MKILICSSSFLPVVGGIQIVGNILANELVTLGHEVKVVTQTPELQTVGSQSKFRFEVIRCPKPYQLIQVVSWCDVFFHNDLSLKNVWPLIFIRRPWIVTHHIWIRKNKSISGLIGYIKHFVLKFATCISISQAIADDFTHHSIIIPNPYQDDVFRKISGIERSKDLIFVGRLVQEKGVHLIIEALAKLQKQGYYLNLTIVGNGPEKNHLSELAEKLDLAEQVAFIGQKQGDDLAAILNSHKVMVVPSLWEEPFGIVALEGIACGCVVVASEGGGLKEAIGNCGLTFPNGDVDKLFQLLFNLFSDDNNLVKYRKEENISKHLSRHSKISVAKIYSQLFKKSCIQK